MSDESADTLAQVRELWWGVKQLSFDDPIYARYAKTAANELKKLYAGLNVRVVAKVGNETAFDGVEFSESAIVRDGHVTRIIQEVFE